MKRPFLNRRTPVPSGDLLTMALLIKTSTPSGGGFVITGTGMSGRSNRRCRVNTIERPSCRIWRHIRIVCRPHLGENSKCRSSGFAIVLKGEVAMSCAADISSATPRKRFVRAADH